MAKKRRRKLRIDRIIILIVVIGIVCLGFYFFFNMGLKSDNNIGNKINNIVLKKKEEKKEYKVSMVMAGDNLIHSSVYKDAYLGNDEYDFTKMYELIKPIVKEYDIAYYNQETILGGKELGVNDYPTFNSPQEVGDAMLDAGFNLVSLATNHTMDSGEKAVLKSREYWDSKSDVIAVGSYASFDDRNKIRIGETNNIKYTMLNYTYGTNGIKVPSGKEYLVNVWPTDLEINDPDKDTKYQDYKEQVKKDIDAVKDKVDLLIVAMHWGVEYTHTPTEYEVDMAKYLASLGVNIIIGTHPHVIQPVTFIDDTLVIYSLGNFISAQYQNNGSCLNYMCTTGLMTSVDITKVIDNGNTSIKIDNVNNELLYTYYNNWRNFKVVPFSNENISNYLPGYKNIYEKYKNVVIKEESDMKVNDCYNN